MFVLALEIIQKCNLRCRYCYLGEKKNKDMANSTIEDAIKIGLENAKKQDDKNLDVYFIGGEPLLAIDKIYEVVRKVVSECRKNDLIPTFSTTTNGTLLTDEIVDFFIENNFDWKISIDGGELINDLNRFDNNGYGSYEKIRSNLRYKDKFERQTQKKVHAAQVITSNNVKYFADSFKHLKNLGFKYIETDIDKYNTWEIDKKEILIQQLEDTIDFYHRSTQSGEMYYWQLFEHFLKDYFTEVPFYACKAAVHSIFVNVDGMYYSCCECPGMEIGNSKLNKIDIDKIKKLITIAETSNKECLKCKYLKRCKARGCITDSYSINGSIFEPSDMGCFLTKSVFEIISRRFNEKEKYELHKHYGGIENG